MKRSIFMIIILSSFFSPLCAKEELKKDAEHYSEDVIIEDSERDDFDLDDFADERRDDPPPQSKDLSFIKKIKILLGIVSHVTADWYYEHVKPNLVEYWQYVVGCIEARKRNEQKTPEA